MNGAKWAREGGRWTALRLEIKSQQALEDTAGSLDVAALCYCRDANPGTTWSSAYTWKVWLSLSDKNRQSILTITGWISREFFKVKKPIPKRYTLYDCISTTLLKWEQIRGCQWLIRGWGREVGVAVTGQHRKSICTHMFTAALLTTGKKRKQPESIDRGMEK